MLVCTSERCWYDFWAVHDLDGYVNVVHRLSSLFACSLQLSIYLLLGLVVMSIAVLLLGMGARLMIFIGPGSVGTRLD